MFWGYLIICMIFVIFSRNVLGTLNLGDILSQRETIAREMQVAFLSSYFTLFCLVVFFRGFRFSVLFNACNGGPLLGDVCKMSALFTVFLSIQNIHFISRFVQLGDVCKQHLEKQFRARLRD